MTYTIYRLTPDRRFVSYEANKDAAIAKARESLHTQLPGAICEVWETDERDSGDSGKPVFAIEKLDRGVRETFREAP